MAQATDPVPRDVGRILICEDEAIIAMDMRERLNELGYSVCGIAPSARQALKLAAEEQPDVVLMDINLRGDMDGIDAAGRLRGAEGPAVIFVTAYGDYETLQRAKITEPYGYLLKPYEERELQIVIEIALYRRRMEQQMRTRERELRAKEEALQQAQKMDAFGRLAGGMAHDFNNLLTAIGGYAEILLMKTASHDVETLQALEAILGASKRASELTRQLLAFSRKRKLAPVVLDVNEHVRGTQKLIGPLFGADYELVFIPGAEAGKILIDPTQLEQVILNLLINARDAMPKGGRITIVTDSSPVDSALNSGPFVTISVRDNGTGIEEKVLARLFEPFFTTKPAGSGTGLGLSIVYGIVKQYDGDIEVSSKVGDGTEFRVFLPRCDADVEADVAPQEIDEMKGAGETILVVEDDDVARTYIRWGLHRYGYEILEAAQPGDALLLAEQHRGRIDLLLSDIELPRINGTELAERLTQLRPDMPVLFMSAHDVDALQAIGIDTGTAALLTKPFTHVQLARAIRDAMCGRPSARA